MKIWKKSLKLGILLTIFSINSYADPLDVVKPEINRVSFFSGKWHINYNELKNGTNLLKEELFVDGNSDRIVTIGTGEKRGFPLHGIYSVESCHKAYVVVYDKAHNIVTKSDIFEFGDTTKCDVPELADTVNPVITLIGENPQVLTKGQAYKELGATALDNRDGDLTKAILIDSSDVDISTTGEYIISYDVVDTSGNDITVTRVVKVVAEMIGELEIHRINFYRGKWNIRYQDLRKVKALKEEILFVDGDAVRTVTGGYNRSYDRGFSFFGDSYAEDACHKAYIIAYDVDNKELRKSAVFEFGDTNKCMKIGSEYKILDVNYFNERWNINYKDVSLSLLYSKEKVYVDGILDRIVNAGTIDTALLRGFKFLGTYAKNECHEVYIELYSKSGIKVKTTKSFNFGGMCKNITYFADENDPDDRLISIDYKNMKLINAVDIEGSRNHKAHSMGTKSEAAYLLLVPVESKFLTVRRLNTGEFVKKIRLPFEVRSAGAYNKQENLMLATGRYRPASVLINAESLELVGKAGFNITCSDSIPLYAENDIKDLTCTTPDHGGNHVTGHGVWLDSKRFVILDRANRKLHIYQIAKNADKKTYNTTLVQTLNTDTSFHTMHKGVGTNQSKYFYAVSESSGKNGNKPSGVYKYQLEDNGTLTQLTFISLHTNDGTKIGVNSHHLEITPDGKFLYVPVGNVLENGIVRQGGIFVVNANDMSIVKFISTGNGAAHVKFSKKRKMSIVTNRNSDYVTIINYETHTYIKDIPLDFTHEGLTSVSQAHTGYVNKNGDYYYSMWVDGGVFFRINLETLELDGSVYVGGTPFSGSYYPSINSNRLLSNPSIDDGYDIVFPDWSM